MRTWVAFFTMTGSEIYHVSRKLNRFPDVVITNRVHLEGVQQELLDALSPEQLVIIPNKPTAEEYVTAISVSKSANPLVTLHGYLRIVPPVICDNYEIINCHPGLITRYPELKGKDPQKRSTNHSHIGTVLHHVTPGVDEGTIIASDACVNVYATADAITHQLKRMSANLWVDLLSKTL